MGAVQYQLRRLELAGQVPKHRAGNQEVAQVAVQHYEDGGLVVGLHLLFGTLSFGGYSGSVSKDTGRRP